MKHHALLAAAVFAVAAGCTSSEGKDEQADDTQVASQPAGDDPLEGTWTITKAVINGQSFPKESQQDVHVGGRYEFQSGRLTKRPNPEFDKFRIPKTHYRYELMPEADPPQLDLAPVVDQDAAARQPPTEKLIYRLEKDRLVLCWSLDLATPRPQDFDTGPGDNKGLYVLERSEE